MTFLSSKNTPSCHVCLVECPANAIGSLHLFDASATTASGHFPNGGGLRHMRDQAPITGPLVWHDFLRVTNFGGDEEPWQIEMYGSGELEADVSSTERAILELAEDESPTKATRLARDGDTLLLLLNFSGTFQLSRGNITRHVEPGQMAVLALNEYALLEPLEDSSLQFLTLTVGRTYLRSHFGHAHKLSKPIQTFLEDCDAILGEVEVGPMPRALLNLPSDLRHPPLEVAAHQGWYRGKILEILAQSIFQIDRAAPHVYRRNTDRIEQVCALLEANLEKPPSLKDLAATVGWSPFHLSRQFAVGVGGTIPAYLRTKRIERAAKLLLNGDLSIEEVAHRVGYRSMPSFTKGFREQMSCLPAEYGAQWRGQGSSHAA